jgi:flagellar motor switch protein FliM
VKRKSKFLYSSSIKLGAALGDWTQLNSQDLDQEYFDVSSISSTNFDKLSRRELKKSHLIHHKLANLIAKHLSKDMNIKIELHTIMVTQILYSDFINSINDNIFQADLSVGEQGAVNIIFGSNLASMMMDRLTGGKGENSDKSNFNELEMTLLNEQLQEIIPFFTNSWKESLDISNAKLSLYSGQYKSDNRISYRETYIVFTIYLYFGDGELMRLMVAYPNDLIRNLLKQEESAKQVITPEVKFQQETLDKIRYNVKAELGSIELPMNSLAGLTPGDVIPLNQSINSLIKLDIGNKIELYGQPCIYNNKVGAQVIVTEDYKNNIILTKNLDKKQSEIKKVRLPIDKIVDQEKNAKTPVFQFDDSVAETVDSENLSEFLPADLSDKTDNVEPQQDDATLEVNLDETVDIADELDLDSSDSHEDLGLTDEQDQETLEDDASESSDGDDELNQESLDLEQTPDLAQKEVVESQESEIKQTIEETSDQDSDEFLEQETQELADSPDPNDQIGDQQEVDLEDSDTQDVLDTEPEDVDEKSDYLESEETDDLELENPSQADSAELVDTKLEPENSDDELNVEAEGSHEETRKGNSKSNNDDAIEDDIFDEELDFGDIEASLEDDSLDWDDTDSPKLD